MRSGLPPNDLARVVTERIAELGTTHQAVADRAGLAPSYISRIASGAIARPENERLEALAAGLEMDVHVLQEAMHQPARSGDLVLSPGLVAGLLEARQVAPTTERLTAIYDAMEHVLHVMTRAYAEHRYGADAYPPDEDGNSSTPGA